MRARLNIFQRTMLHWNDLHPYNAVHIARVPAAFNETRLALAINGTLEHLGLTNLTLDRKRHTYAYQGGPAQSEIRRLPVTAGVPTALAAEIEAQLNRAFITDGDFNPFRFFVVPDPDAFYLGAVYFHAVADAEALVHLLRRIIAVYRDETLPTLPGFERHPARRDHLWQLGPELLWRKLTQLPAHLRNLRRSVRARYADPNEGRIGFTYLSLDLAALHRVVATAKTWGVTVNDLFLALMLKSLASLPGSRGNGKRDRLSLGCIVNLRKDLELDGPRTFGLFLGSFLVGARIPGDQEVSALAMQVHKQTTRIKERRLYAAAALELAVAGRLLGFFSTERRKKLYQKNYPLWGGITNMNLNALWPQAADQPPVDYFRAVSTGPVTPLVLSVTTVGPVANIGLTYRTTVFSPEAIAHFQNTFREGLQSLPSP